MIRAHDFLRECHFIRPYINPIKEAFVQLKAWFKKNYQLANDMIFDEFLGIGINLIKEGAKNHFI